MKRDVDQTKALIYGGCVVILWSTVATAFKIALNDLSPALLLLIASIVTVFISLMDIIRRGEINSLIEDFRQKRGWAESALQGLINPFIYYLILFKAYSLLPAQIAQPLNFSWQVILVIMLVVVMKQKISVKIAIGILISFIGVILLTTNNNVAIDGKLSLLGLILTIISTFLWAGYWIMRLKSTESSSTGLFKNFLFATIYLLIYLVIFPDNMFLHNSDGSTIYPQTASILAALYTGVCEMGITFILWGQALKLAKNKLILTQMTYLAPVISLIFISVILKERINMVTIAGLLMIIGGLLISNSREKKKIE